MYESILISVIFIFIYIFLFVNKTNLMYVEAHTGTKFLVHKDSKTQEKANILGEIVQNLYKLRNYLVANKNNFPDHTEYITLLENNFQENKTSVYETDPDSDLTSYSVNKGEEISFCLTSKKTGQIHNINLLMYVAIHEIAHIACPEIGHGDVFKKIFKKFIEEAIKIGIYHKVDYALVPNEYCGMILSSSIV